MKAIIKFEDVALIDSYTTDFLCMPRFLMRADDDDDDDFDDEDDFDCPEKDKCGPNADCTNCTKIRKFKFQKCIKCNWKTSSSKDKIDLKDIFI